MAVDTTAFISSISGGTVSTVKWFVIIVGVLIAVVVILGLFIWWRYTRSKYNLRVEVKLVRSNGQVIDGEWAKGSFNPVRGVVIIKRAKKKGVAMKCIDIRRYLQGSDLLTVIQLGPEDYRPVLYDSWTGHLITYENEKGEKQNIKESVLNIRVDTGEYKAWKSSWDAASKRAYSLQSFLQQFQVPIAIAIVLIACFVGFAILYTRIKPG
jgi:hypothetical protein